jgi:imidazoleglycerol phosphate dehydratase HisB
MTTYPADASASQFAASPREHALTRKTSETSISCRVRLDGSGRSTISTGLGFLDHMLTALSRHSGVDIDLTCTGDLHIDDHHTAEDCALALASAIDAALADRRGIIRFGYAYAPLDESLARAVIDLSGRACAVVNLDLKREFLGPADAQGPARGAIACENLSHVIHSLAANLRAAIHVDVLRGQNDHHKAEAAFKALALALKQAVARTGSSDIPSTKGAL